MRLKCSPGFTKMISPINHLTLQYQFCLSVKKSRGPGATHTKSILSSCIHPLFSVDFPKRLNFGALCQCHPPEYSTNLTPNAVRFILPLKRPPRPRLPQIGRGPENVSTSVLWRARLVMSSHVLKSDGGATKRARRRKIVAVAMESVFEARRGGERTAQCRLQRMSQRRIKIIHRVRHA